MYCTLRSDTPTDAKSKKCKLKHAGAVLQAQMAWTPYVPDGPHHLCVRKGKCSARTWYAKTMRTLAVEQVKGVKDRQIGSNCRRRRECAEKTQGLNLFRFSPCAYVWRSGRDSPTCCGPRNPVHGIPFDSRRKPRRGLAPPRKRKCLLAQTF